MTPEQREQIGLNAYLTVLQMVNSAGLVPFTDDVDALRAVIRSAVQHAMTNEQAENWKPAAPNHREFLDDFLGPNLGDKDVKRGGQE